MRQNHAAGGDGPRATPLSAPCVSSPRWPTRLEHWRLSRLLGRGGGGVVVAATPAAHCAAGVAPPPLVALKLLSKADLRASNRVVRAVAEYDVLRLQLEYSHPFIVPVRALFQTRGFLCAALDLMEGGTLRELLARQPSRRIESEHVAQGVVAELLCALEFLHARGIVVRDIKSENILLSCSGHIALGDFGLARTPRSARWRPRAKQEAYSPRGAVSAASMPSSSVGAAYSASLGVADVRGASDGSKSLGGQSSASVGGEGVQRPEELRLRRRTSLVGSPEYVAPEVVADDEVTAQCDMWGVGVLLYEMIFGATPFAGGSAADIMRRVATHTAVPFPAVPRISRELRALLTELLCRDPSKRCRIDGMRSHAWFRHSGVDFRALAADDAGPLLPLLHDPRAASRPSSASATASLDAIVSADVATCDDDDIVFAFFEHVSSPSSTHRGAMNAEDVAASISAAVERGGVSSSAVAEAAPRQAPAPTCFSTWRQWVGL